MGMMAGLFSRDGATRPLTSVPVATRTVLLAALCMQLCCSHWDAPARARERDLPVAPAAGLLRLAGMGEPGATARALMLWLQAFDDQPGVSIPFARLDYARVIGWLHALLALDNRFQYPLLSASRVYTQTPDQGRQRQMLEFVYQRFLEDPARRWPWLAHGIYIARHRLADLPLALKYASALRVNTSADNAPRWVAQLELPILEQLGEPERARSVMAALLASDRLTDNELRLLKHRLAQPQQHKRE